MSSCFHGLTFNNVDQQRKNKNIAYFKTFFYLLEKTSKAENAINNELKILVKLTLELYWKPGTR